jgi:LmbE family N-acetylglucosaminyl deacetylase
MRGQAGLLPPDAAPRHVGKILTAALKTPASDLRTLTLGKPILVIAPHPDDEVLGCGGLLAACAAAGIRTHVAFLTDGSLSHPGSASWSQKRIAAQRAAEALRAAQILGLSHRDLTFLNKRDGRLLFERAQMIRAGGQLSRLVRRLNVRTIFVTWRHDPHPDHVAAALIAAHVRRAAPHLRVFHYPIWAHLLPHDVSIADGPWRPIRFDVSRWLNVKRRALTAYRTQTSTLIADAPITLRLQREQLDALMTRNEIFLRQN